MAEKVPKGKLVIRTAKPEDIETIKQLRSLRKLERGLAESKLLIGEKVFVALLDGKVVGFCQCGQKPETKNVGRVSELAVVEGLKISGIGHKLLGKAHSFFLTKGFLHHELTPKARTQDFYLKARYDFKKRKRNITVDMGKTHQRRKHK